MWCLKKLVSSHSVRLKALRVSGFNHDFREFLEKIPIEMLVKKNASPNV